ncbi:MAG: exo-alpha-sialidase [Planctomycetes bacterium]|nr:exo-alpha-sialidase [Planctomycetota bacterium]
MSRIDIVDKGIIFRNPLPGHRVANAFYPEILCLTDSEWLCVLRIGGALYSPDGVLELFRTTDAGASWIHEGPVRARGPDNMHYNESEGTITRLRDRSLVLRMLRCDHSHPDLLAYNPATQGLMPVETAFFRSFDGGRTWSDAVVPDIRSHFPGSIEATPYGRVVELDDGTWFHTFETWKSYDNAGTFDLNIYGLFSRDGGRTWHDQTPVAVGTQAGRSYSHGMTIRRRDGRIFLAVWTAEAQLQSSYDLCGVLSSDPSGRAWEAPVSLRIPGQTSCPVELRPGLLVIVYSHRERTEQPGIKAVASDDDGHTWSLATPAILWDAYGKESLGVARSSTYPSSHDAIAYGAPKITRLDDATAIASFWCTQGGDTHCRWCCLKVSGA